VKVYLLLVNEEECFFYSDDSEVDESCQDDLVTQSGFLGRLRERWRNLQRQLWEAEAGAARWARRSWDWLHSRARPDEAMLARLRSTRQIDLHHPASRSEDAVSGIWHRYLAQRERQHVVCLVCNGTIAPFALALLWPLPGPNLIGYWFAYRAIHHWLVVRGIKLVRLGWIPTRFHEEATLDLPIDLDETGKARHEAIAGEGLRLDDYLNQPRGVVPERGSSLARLLVPNSLSLARIGLALVFPWVPVKWRAGVVVAAGLSDLFDGRLSRALQGTSLVGQILDPVADKLFVGIVLITLVVEGRLTWVELLLLGFRDLAVLAGSTWSIVRHGWRSLRQMPPSWLGKLATAGQLGFLLLLCLGMNQTMPLYRLAEAAAVSMSVAAGLGYLWQRSSMTIDHETSELQHP
jgi:phosphatidylglycerophosphate synthase